MSSGNPTAPPRLPSPPQHTLWLEHCLSSTDSLLIFIEPGNYEKALRRNLP